MAFPDTLLSYERPRVSPGRLWVLSTLQFSLGYGDDSAYCRRSFPIKAGTILSTRHRSCSAIFLVPDDLSTSWSHNTQHHTNSVARMSQPRLVFPASIIKRFLGSFCHYEMQEGRTPVFISIITSCVPFLLLHMYVKLHFYNKPGLNEGEEWLSSEQLIPQILGGCR